MFHKSLTPAPKNPNCITFNFVMGESIVDLHIQCL